MNTNDVDQLASLATENILAAQMETYVRAALAIQQYSFSEARIAEVVQHFARIEQMSRVVRSAELPPALEPAPVFRP